MKDRIFLSPPHMNGTEMEFINEAFRTRINSIISFGRQIKDNIVNSWEFAKNTEIKLDFKRSLVYN